MNAGFTSGPWTFGIRDDGSMWQSRGDPVKGPHYQSDFYGTGADARLIAAAPEMFDTLEKLRADLAEEDAERHAQRIAVIDLTIAEARGDA